MINKSGKINAYLTHVSYPTIKNLVEQMNENNHTVEKVALSLQNMKNYIWDNIAPLQKVTNSKFNRKFSPDGHINLHLF